MAERAQYEELARQLSAIGAVKRELARILPHDCPAGSAAVLTLLGRHGDMRMSRLAELLAVDMSVTSRHVAHVADRGWIERLPDPADRRSRILRLTDAGHARLDELSQRSSQLFADRLSDWSDHEVGLLSHLMGRLRESFGDSRTTQRLPCPAEAAAVHAPEPTTTRTPA
ncbi:MULTISPECIES: MarR family winged helix-turn-helix transcriptional regulator [unclassified Streptomyces]|uniref:MarR family winged helix-turn-helix transcriptional regulator n=1 Tax=unclassified Streptomyces TaxID=2593676 RepID=UPI0011CE4FAA|nr:MULTISPECIES: MarR family transcriptional regulator [unclassified Streptomyces]TXS76942.1 MarR family transcriptional regulator [Streptomyces sp. me109]